ncbi:LCP family protein [Paenibacillus sepulcri]|uniref:LCP family protein n=1 Tax=Paenibacillus sepulcri TaxID=359917 RepID=A0ABS7C252_9BACL|nr:LCP family protein [Paenibacillus sepulcri]
MPRVKSNKKRPWLKPLIIVLSILFVVVGGVGAYAAYQGYGIYNQLDTLQKPKEESRFGQFEVKEEEKPVEWEGTERVNILLMGGDNRGLEKNEAARSDSMLVASIDPVTKKAHLFSVLRDTYVPIEGHGEGRINTALALGGPNLAMKTIGGMLGLDIQYYVYTDFEGFKSLIDAIGGIDFDVEKNMNYVDNADGNRYDIHLKKGFQHLDGEHALMYVRFRHDAMSDFTRTERQRNFLDTVADKLKNGWNLLKMKQILESVNPYIETNLDISDMLKLAQLGVKTQLAGQAQVPPMDNIGDRKVSGASVLSIRDDDELLTYVQEILTEDSAVPDATASGTGNADGASANTSGSGNTGSSTNTGNTSSSSNTDSSSKTNE